MIKLEYKITYQIGADIPINPSWIGDQIQASVKKLQAKIDKKNLMGQHKLKLQLPDGWKLQASSSKLQAWQWLKDTIGLIKRKEIWIQYN